VPLKYYSLRTVQDTKTNYTQHQKTVQQVSPTCRLESKVNFPSFVGVVNVERTVNKKQNLLSTTVTNGVFVIH